MLKYALIGVPFVVGGVVTFALLYLWLTGTPWRVGGPPQQPIAFFHSIHVQTVGLDCLFCHREADKGPAATVPSVEQCMACHSVITSTGPAGAEIAKVREAWNQGQEINWVKVHQLPDHVRFTHQAHIQAGIACATCHGDVGSMQQVSQVRSLRMGDCVACHRANNAPTDCVKCHY